MDTDFLIPVTLVAGEGALVALGMLIYDVWFRDRWRVHNRLDAEFGGLHRRSFTESRAFKLQSEEPQWGVVWRLRLLLEQSRLPITLGRVFSLAICLGLLCSFGVLFVAPHWIVAIPAGFLGLASPVVFLWRRCQKRQKLLRDQLPEAFELMSRGVRSGQTIPTALRLVAVDGNAPIAEEFAFCCEQQKLGLPQEVTLREMARRNGIMELQMFAVALLVQRQTGGSPVEILNNLSQVVRQRIRIRGRVRAATSEVRMQAVVLSILPVVSFIAIYFLKQDYAQILIDRPLLLAGMLGSSLLGSLWIRTIINFDY
jgi:tight adherence protein B